MHGQFLRDKEGMNWDRSWEWIAKGDMKVCTGALICGAQEQALRTYYTSILIRVLSLRCVECMGRKWKRSVIWLVSVASWHKGSIRKGMIMWHDTFIGNSVAKGDLGEQIDGIISNLMQLLKMRIVSSYGILRSNVIE